MNIDWKDVSKIPNLITIGRIPLAWICLYALSPFAQANKTWEWLAYLGLTVAILLDLLDGVLARRWKQESALGKWLDPFADKLVTTPALIILWPYFLTELVVIFISLDGLSTWLRSRKAKVEGAIEFGRKKTVFSSIAILTAALPEQTYLPSEWIIPLVNTSLGIAILLSLLSLGKRTEAKGWKWLIPAMITFFSAAGGTRSSLIGVQMVFGLAAVLTYICAILDSCDGAMASLLNAKTEIGEYLDDIADFIAFGANPGILIAAYSGWSQEGWSIGIIYSCCVGWRLKKFSEDPPAPAGFFRGMPCPAGAWLVVSTMLCDFPYWAIQISAVISGILMITFHIYWPKFVFILKNMKLEERIGISIILLASLIFQFFLGIIVLKVALLVLIIPYLFSFLWRKPTP